MDRWEPSMLEDRDIRAEGISYEKVTRCENVPGEEGQLISSTGKAVLLGVE